MKNDKSIDWPCRFSPLFTAISCAFSTLILHSSPSPSLSLSSKTFLMIDSLTQSNALISCSHIFLITASILQFIPPSIVTGNRSALCLHLLLTKPSNILNHFLKRFLLDRHTHTLHYKVTMTTVKRGLSPSPQGCRTVCSKDPLKTFLLIPRSASLARSSLPLDRAPIELRHLPFEPNRVPNTADSALFALSTAFHFRRSFCIRFLLLLPLFRRFDWMAIVLHSLDIHVTFVGSPL
jgi:hypothetical protein